jgi:predicted PurR-regulated permease PerM
MGEKIDGKTSATIEWSFFTVLSGFLIFFLFIGITWLLRALLAPVLVALLLALLFLPMIEWAQKHWDMPPWLSLTLLLLLLTAICTTLSIIGLPVVYEQISDFLSNLPDHIDRISQALFGEKVTLSEGFKENLSKASEKPENILPLLLKGSLKSLGILAHTLSMVTYVIIYILLMLVFFVAFCLYLPRIRQWLWQFLPHSKRDHIAELSGNIYSAAGTFFRTRLLIALILAILFSAGWGLAGVPYWLLLGVATGILSIVPYAAGLGWIAAMLVNAVDAGSSGQLVYALLWPTVVYSVIQFLEGWFLTPYLQGGRLHIHPVVVLFVVLAGGALAGILGMLLAIPLTAAGQMIFSDIIKPRLKKWASNN